MRRILVVIVGLLTLAHIGYGQQAARLHPHRIAVFGSSVANGRGDETARDGYTGLLRVMMAQRGWEVLNQSRGGDNTKTLMTRFAPDGAPDPKTRYLTTVNPSYVVVGLSFGNENLFESKTKAEKDAVYDGYLKGIRAVVDRARQNGIIPVVMLCYTRDLYTPQDYEYVRRANVEQAQWDVPTVNVLGAIDDGKGHWALGWDDKHPQASGHAEFAYAFVPSLFEALEKGKPNPVRAASGGFAHIASATAPLTFAPTETMHPFAISVMVRTQTDGTLSAISGSTLATRTEIRVNEDKPFTATTLVADKPFAASLVVQDGRFGYKSAAKTTIDSGVRADAQWHDIVLSHFTARGETVLFVDGKQVGTVAERLEPKNFVVGSRGDFKDLFLYRAALNADEVAALHADKMLKGSLEIYSSLTDAEFRAGGTVENRAQSLTAFKVGTDRIVHVEEGTSTR
ncbi:MAG TPA: SGNH/GDSL hydrolase family protein [Vicinamibacterales bacterium]|jgi:lysophospholipase L1-like esterase|nr:SGNH/GDSL hydrolase family protein [Vicinamibacterales bacterium]